MKIFKNLVHLREDAILLATAIILLLILIDAYVWGMTRLGKDLNDMAGGASGGVAERVTFNLEEAQKILSERGMVE